MANPAYCLGPHLAYITRDSCTTEWTQKDWAAEWDSASGFNWKLGQTRSRERKKKEDQMITKEKVQLQLWPTPIKDRSLLFFTLLDLYKSKFTHSESLHHSPSRQVASRNLSRGRGPHITDSWLHIYTIWDFWIWSLCFFFIQLQ